MQSTIYRLQFLLTCVVLPLLCSTARSQSGDLTADALTWANAQLKEKPDNPDVLCLRCKAHFFKKDYVKAEQDIDRAISIAPKPPLYRYFRLEVLMRLKKSDLVLKETDQLGKDDMYYGLFIAAGALKLDDEVDELFLHLELYPKEEKAILKKLLAFKERAAKRAVTYLWYPPRANNLLLQSQLNELLGQLGEDADKAISEGQALCERHRTLTDNGPRDVREWLAGIKVGMDIAREKRTKK